MKSYTDLEQSKKLAEFLPLESADMHYNNGSCRGVDYTEHFSAELMPYQEALHLMKIHKTNFMFQVIPCWSLSALINLLPKEIEIDGQHYAPCLFPVESKWLLKLWYNSNYTFTSPIAIFSDNLIDACVEMIIKLHKLNLL